MAVLKLDTLDRLVELQIALVLDGKKAVVAKTQNVTVWRKATHLPYTRVFSIWFFGPSPTA